MKFDRKEWNFHAVLWEFLELKCYFDSDESWDYYPWFTQVEVKKVVAALNAITGSNYEAETINGKKEILEAFRNGFGLEATLYTESQKDELKSILRCDDLFNELGKMALPYVGEFYEELYLAFEAGHKYITRFDFVPTDVKNDPVFRIVDGFKYEKQDKLIYNKNRLISKAMIILLGKKFNRTFATDELIEKYSYPDVCHDEINKAKIAFIENNT